VIITIVILFDKVCSHSIDPLFSTADQKAVDSATKAGQNLPIVTAISKKQQKIWRKTR